MTDYHGEEQDQIEATPLFNPEPLPPRRVSVDVEVTEYMLEEARQMCTGSTMNDHTIVREDMAGQLAGFCGELAFKELLDRAGLPYRHITRRASAYDFVVKKVRIDVKTKLRCRYLHALGVNHDHEIPAYSQRQVCDVYAFASAHYEGRKSNIKTIKFVGAMAHGTFWKGERVEKGQAKRCGNVCRKDAVLVYYNDTATLGKVFTYLIGLKE